MSSAAAGLMGSARQPQAPPWMGSCAACGTAPMRAAPCAAVHTRKRARANCSTGSTSQTQVWASRPRIASWPRCTRLRRSCKSASRTRRVPIAWTTLHGRPSRPSATHTGCVAAAPADVVVLNSDCVVAEGWLQGLRRAAYSDALVATASALTNHGTILSVPERNRPQPGIPQDQTLAHTAGAVRSFSLRFYPHLPTAIGHCMYIRRQALDLVGQFDLAFSPGYGEEVDFSQRCVLP